MSSEKPRLNEELAHDEANMIQHKAGVSPETMKIDGSEVTSEDYDRASAAIEELKRLIKEEPASVKVFHLISDIVRVPVLGQELLGNMLIHRGQGWEKILEDYLSDTSKRLEVLKVQGAKFGKKQAEG